MRNYIKNKMLKAIKQYGMLSEKNIPVAFSGGKDSATCIFLLSELGYFVNPVIVDRNDDDMFDSKNIAYFLKKFGYSSKIINLRNYEYLSALPQFLAIKFCKFLKEVECANDCNSACTPCYNARTLALSNFSKIIGSNEYVLGMHKTDLLTSFVRFYWIEKYFFAFTKTRGLPYNTELAKHMIQEEELDLEYLYMMVNMKRAATDDPPVEVLENGTRIVRPMIGVSEKDIISFIEEIGYPHISTNCKFRQNSSAVPLRLIVQYDLVKRMENDSNLEEKLYELSELSINKDGTLKFRPRNNVSDNYPGFDPTITSKL